MRQIHLKEKEQLKKLFKQEDIDRFEDRYQIYETFLQTERHVTVSELHELLRESRPDLEPEFIRDTLQLMCRFGFAQRSRFNNGLVRYEHRHLGQHHDHMICTKCNKVFEFEDQALENMQIQIAAMRGFHMLQHKMELYGICDQCQKARSPLLPLSAAKQGEKLIIKDFTGGATARMRLLSMGLRIGDAIDVITNMNQGQVVVAADFRRYVLGRGLAHKIMVQPAKTPQKTD